MLLYSFPTATLQESVFETGAVFKKLASAQSDEGNDRAMEESKGGTTNDKNGQENSTIKDGSADNQDNSQEIFWPFYTGMRNLKNEVN